MIALTVEQAVDQMQVSGATASGANRKLSRQLRLGARRERRAFLMTHVDPLDDPVAPQGVREAIERVTHHAINAFDTGMDECLGKQVGRSSCHVNSAPDGGGSP
jgi:hypothetical protein